MTKARYQLLPDSDTTPAMEVELSSASSDSSEATSSSSIDQAIQTQPQSQQQQAPIATATATGLYLDEVTQIAILAAASGVEMHHLPPVSELPSYIEAIKLKKLESDATRPTDLPPSYNSSGNGIDTRVNMDDSIDLRATIDVSDLYNNDQEIGTECMFLCAFMISFFFNWVGFFASVCLLPNAAGKYGALSGFGLSMAKWVTIVRYQEWMANMNDFQQKLFFWLFIFFGFYLFFRGLVNFMTLKYRPRTDYSRQIRERWFGIIE